MSINPEFKYKVFSSGDISASVAIIFDNLTVLTAMSLILMFGFNFPSNIILNHIIPGTITGVILGNVLFFILALKMAKAEQKHITAIPFGLDAPTGIGFSLFIVGPIFLFLKQQNVSIDQAATISWQVGVGCLFAIGIIKLLICPFADKLKSIIPNPALLGAIGGVGLALLGTFPLLSMFKMPIVGLVSLAIVFLPMFARMSLPFKLPSILVAVGVSSSLYYLLIPFGLSGHFANSNIHVEYSLPTLSFAFVNYSKYIMQYIGVAIPFAFLVVFGSMSVAEGARCVGENYTSRNLILIDAISTLVSSIFGGIAQTTPYAGIPAYKKMEAHSGFLLLNILVVGIGGLFGLVTLIINFIPEAALGSVLLFIGFEIVMQGFVTCDKKYYPAILLSILPSIARVIQSIISDGSIITNNKLQEMFFMAKGDISNSFAVFILGNGFIIIGMLWASLLCFAIDRQWKNSFICSLILSIMSYFGIIHSVYVNGQMYLPSMLPAQVRLIPVQLSIGYLMFGGVLLILARLQRNKLFSHPHN